AARGLLPRPRRRGRRRRHRPRRPRGDRTPLGRDRAVRDRRPQHPRRNRRTRKKARPRLRPDGRGARTGRPLDARAGRARHGRTPPSAPARPMGGAGRVARSATLRESAEMSVHGRRWHGPPLTSRAVSELDEEVVPGRPREFIQSLQRGLEIIRAFGPHAPVQTVSELATTTGLTRATARRFLITLIELGYVETDGRTFRLTPRVLELGYSFLSGLGSPDGARPHAAPLVAEVDESSEASVLDGEEIVYVVRVPSTSVMTLAVNVGGRMP